MKYTDPRYAYQRLDRTFILHNNKLSMVIGFDDFDDNKIILSRKSGRRLGVKVEELDLTPVPLGYINFRDTCCYTSRMPMRRDWRQGLRQNTLFRQAYEPCEDNFNIETNQDMYKLEKTCLGLYPTFRECVDKVEETHRARAFSRKFAINELGKVIYKSTEEVGNIEDERAIRLNTKFSYLKELLEESLVNRNNRDEIVEVRIR